MMKAHRIGMYVLDEELKELINASAKIFPITQTDVDSNNNPNNYEYGRVGNRIYRWTGDAWEYIIADDIDISWDEIKNKPVVYNPIAHKHTEADISDLDKYTKAEVDTKVNSKSDKNHTHTELHTHNNKNVLDIITQAGVDIWNTVVNKADKNHNHNTLYNTKAEITGLLAGKSDTTHNHDGAYYKKSEVDSGLSGKSDKNHTHVEGDITDLDKYTRAEVDGMLSGKSNVTHKHTESDISDLDKYTKAEVDAKLNTKFDKSGGEVFGDVKAQDWVAGKEFIIGYDGTSDSLQRFKFVYNGANGYLELWRFSRTAGQWVLSVTFPDRNAGNGGITVEGKPLALKEYVDSTVNAIDKYTKAEVDTKLSLKSNTNHTHTELHTHSNKSILDKLIETAPELTYDISNLQYIDDIKNGYTEGHAHNNLQVLNLITAIKLDGWDRAVDHITDTVRHITSAERTKWNTVDTKSDINHNHNSIYSPLGHKHVTLYSPLDHHHDDEYSAIDHTHNDIYYTITAIDDKLSSKSDKTHTHTDKADKSYVDTELAKKSDKTYVDTELNKKADNTTLAYHVNNTDIHVTTVDKSSWNNKSDKGHKHTKSEITDFPTSLPANGGAADILRIPDTRNVDDTPGDLQKRGFTGAFKLRGTIGNPPVSSNSSYVFIMTVAGYGSASDGSGGWPIQIAYGKEGLAFRQGISTSSWGSWAKIANLDDIPTKVSQLINDNGFLTSLPEHNHDTLYEPKNPNIQSHITNTSNPHNVTKSQIGLGSVSNYGIATQSEAEIGTTNAKYMTPLRVKQAIDKNSKPAITTGTTKPTDGSMWYEVIE